MNKLEQRFLPYLGVVSDRQIAEAAGLKLPAVAWWRRARNIKGLGIQASPLDPYMHWFANSTLTPDEIHEIAGRSLSPKAMKAYARDPKGMAMRLARRAAFLCKYEGLTLQPIPPNLLVDVGVGATLETKRIEAGLFNPSDRDEDYTDRKRLAASIREAIEANNNDVDVAVEEDGDGLPRDRPEAVGQEVESGGDGGESVSLTPSQPYTDITVSFKLAIVRGAEAYLSPEEVEASVRQALTDMLSEGDLMADVPDEIAVGMRMKQAGRQKGEGDEWEIAVGFGD